MNNDQEKNVEGRSVGHRNPIILLEDDVALRSLMADGLRDDGYTVSEAANTREAELLLDRAGGRAVLVADRSVGAGPANGFEVAARALDRYEGLKVIYVSGTHVAVRQRQLSSRERGLLKPFALSQLVALIHQLH